MKGASLAGVTGSLRLIRDGFDQIAVGIGQANDKAAAGRVGRLDRRALGGGERFEIGAARDAKGEAAEARFTRFRDMRERRTIGPAGVKPIILFETGQAEILEECLHRAEVRRGEAHMRNILCPCNAHRPRLVVDYLVNLTDMTI